MREKKETQVGDWKKIVNRCGGGSKGIQRRKKPVKSSFVFMTV